GGRGVREVGEGIGGLRSAIAGDYFERGAEPEALDAVTRVAKALGSSKKIVIPEAAVARSAAYIITAIEGSQLHLPRLRTRAQDFDPDTRERFMAGALLPGAWYVKAQRFRRRYRTALQKLFEEVDVILASATPCTAPKLGQVMMTLGGVEMPVRANLGLYTQPISFIGLPVAVRPCSGRLADWRADLLQPQQGSRCDARGAPSREGGRRQRPSGLAENGHQHPRGRGRGHRRLQPLRKGVERQRRRRARRALLEKPAHASLRRRRAALTSST